MVENINYLIIKAATTIKLKLEQVDSGLRFLRNL